MIIVCADAPHEMRILTSVNTRCEQQQRQQRRKKKWRKLLLLIMRWTRLPIRNPISLWPRWTSEWIECFAVFFFISAFLAFRTAPPRTYLHTSLHRMQHCVGSRLSALRFYRNKVNSIVANWILINFESLIRIFELKLLCRLSWVNVELLRWAPWSKIRASDASEWKANPSIATYCRCERNAARK